MVKACALSLVDPEFTRVNKKLVKKFEFMESLQTFDIELEQEYYFDAVTREQQVSYGQLRLNINARPS